MSDTGEDLVIIPGRWLRDFGIMDVIDDLRAQGEIPDEEVAIPVVDVGETFSGKHLWSEPPA